MKKGATEGKKMSVTHVTKYLHLKYTKKSKTQTERRHDHATNIP